MPATAITSATTPGPNRDNVGHAVLIALGPGLREGAIFGGVSYDRVDTEVPGRDISNKGIDEEAAADDNENVP